MIVEIEDLEGSIVQKYCYEDYSADNSERGSTLAFAVQVESRDRYFEQVDPFEVPVKAAITLLQKMVDLSCLRILSITPSNCILAVYRFASNPYRPEHATVWTLIEIFIALI